MENQEILASVSYHSLNTPIVTQKKFAEVTGLSTGAVRGMVERGQLPTLKIGKYRFINITAIEGEKNGQ